MRLIVCLTLMMCFIHMYIAVLNGIQIMIVNYSGSENCPIVITDSPVKHVHLFLERKEINRVTAKKYVASASSHACSCSSV